MLFLNIVNYSLTEIGDLMSIWDILRKFGIIIIAVMALLLSRMGIGYLTILVAIGILTPIICGSKKDAIFTGILYATISYILSYPAGLFLINYMPEEYIPITVSSSTVATNLFIGWLVPVLVSIMICGLASFIGNLLADFINNKTAERNDDEHYFEASDELNQIDTDNLNKKEKRNLLYLTPIQKAKNRNKENNE